jgi:hypothetical protein
VDADVAASGTANIARNKLATGTAHAIGVNDASGYLTSAAALTNGQLLVGSSSGAPVAANISAGTGVSVSNGPGTIQVAIGQSVATSAAPTFAGTTLTGLTASQYVKTDGSKALSSAATIPASDVTAIPYDLPCEIPGTPPTSTKVVNFKAVRAFNLAATGHQGGQLTNPSGDFVCTVAKNGTSIGTITFAAGGFSHNITATSFAAGDVLSVETPAAALGIDTPFFTLAMTLA